tara:strand:+ start:75022 stop:76683 length:1662 start_codon:yes stop_codon:yes gene_type:complete
MAFTDKYKYDKYYFTDENGRKVRNMFINFLDDISKNEKVFEKIQNLVKSFSDINGNVGYHPRFEKRGGSPFNKWFIRYNEVRFHRGWDTEIEMVSDLNILDITMISDIYDQIMSNFDENKLAKQLNESSEEPEYDRYETKKLLKIIVAVIPILRKDVSSKLDIPENNMLEVTFSENSEFEKTLIEDDGTVNDFDTILYDLIKDEIDLKKCDIWITYVIENATPNTLDYIDRHLEKYVSVSFGSGYFASAYPLSDIINKGNKALKKINENFSNQFITDDSVIKIFSSLLTKINNDDPQLLEYIVDKMNDGGSGNIDPITDRPTVWWIGEGNFITSFGFDYKDKLWYIAYSNPNNYDREQDHFYVTNGSVYIKDHDVNSLRDMLDFIMEDSKIIDVVNSKAMKNINKPLKKFNEYLIPKLKLKKTFSDQFETDDKIRMAFNGLMNMIYNNKSKDGGINLGFFYKMVDIFSINSHCMVNDNRDFISNIRPSNNKYWWIYYKHEIPSVDDEEKRMSSETCDIKDIKKILDRLWQEPRIKELVNMPAMRSINNSSVNE